MLSSNLSLSVEKTVRYNNKSLISNTDMKILSNKDIKMFHKKLLVIPLGTSKAGILH